jgi:hypothetical protein
MSTPRQFHDVKAISFEGYDVSSDGELVIFTVRDKAGTSGHIAVDWLALTTTIQLIGRGAERAAQARKQLGKSDDFTPVGGITAQVVSSFQVSEYPNGLKILSLQSPTGFRCDFAIPNTSDQLGRTMSRAIAEELLKDSTQERQRPN